MATAVSNAVGTQKQFRKQPQSVYQKSLKDPSFGSSIGQGKDLGAEQLATSLGVLGKAIWKEKVEHEKREMNQLTLDEALNMVAGKTPEELAKFNVATALQHSNTGFNLTDNKYAMAMLERAMGMQAAFLTKQEYLTETEGIVPESVEKAVSTYTERFQDSLKKYEGNIQNKEAFNSGVYDSFYKDSLIVAEKAREMIDRDKREAGLRCSSTAFQNLLTNPENLSPTVFKGNFEKLAREVQLYTKTAEETSEFWKKVLKENDAIITPAQLDAIKKTSFFVVAKKDSEGKEYLEERKFADEIPLGAYYKKAAEKTITKTATDIANACRRPDGSIDLNKATKMANQFAEGKPKNLIPAIEVNMGDKAEDVAKLTPEFQGSLSGVFGILLNNGFGYDDAVISSAYREPGQAGNAGAASYHTTGDAIDIDLGQGKLSRAEGNALAEKFKPYFEEVIWEMEGDPTGATGDHLHLGGYKGGLEVTDNSTDVDGLAYVPDYQDKLMSQIKSLKIDADNLNKERWTQNENQLIVDIYQTKDNDSIRALINNADLPEYIKVKYHKALDASIEEQTKQAEKLAKGGQSTTEKRWLDYEKNQLEKDRTKVAFLLERQKENVLTTEEEKQLARLKFEYDGYLSFIDPNHQSIYGWQNGIHITDPRYLTTADRTPLIDWKKQEEKQSMVAYPSQSAVLKDTKAKIQIMRDEGYSEEEIKTEVRNFYKDRLGLDYDSLIDYLLEDNTGEKGKADKEELENILYDMNSD